ncbi:hypothetical protein FHS39_000706 [Streptomyces olivoverticillatus]|uniref:Uncharacterized protein n=1 Tax=Streptomyces olivoverticillatus TaxID=66427 RepID=A0A7W7LL96_9ACTN|nr:hypothetical protein [Streptomyces olivoverticillatus]MBB4891706.1 hypothetical protein [Streptomyces olivoverticillatus]
MGTGGGAGDKLYAELQSLKIFKGRVDEVLTELGDSEAAPSRVSEARLEAGLMGVNFAEVNSLHSAYNNVHSQLETLSQLLSDMIEALGTAVHGARVGYENIDIEVKERMWAVQRRTQELFGSPSDSHTQRCNRSSQVEF